MCGLVGVVSYSFPQHKLEDLLKQSLILNSLRGTDSAGIAVVDRKNNVQMYKRNFPGWDVAQLIGTESLLKSPDTVFALVHNRSSTTGGSGVGFAHPIIEGKISLIHNGTLHSLHTIGGSYGQHDSTLIAQRLNSSADEKTVLQELLGAYALIWHNSEDGTFNVARNKERPLFVARIKNDGMIFASEGLMLHWLVQRNGIAVKGIAEVPVGQHWKIYKDATTKMVVKKFSPGATQVTRSPNLANINNNSHHNRGYSLVVAGEEFKAEYVGTIKKNDAWYLKFRHINDPIYAWVLPAGSADHANMPLHQYYWLRAMESRRSSASFQDLEAEIIGKAYTHVHTVGQEILFMVDKVFTNSGQGLKSFIGTCELEDGTEVEVRGHRISSEIMVGDYCRGTIASIGHSKKGGAVILIISNNSIATVSMPTTQLPAIIAEQKKCDWCETTLTPKEVIQNTFPHVGTLCDGCARGSEYWTV